MNNYLNKERFVRVIATIKSCHFLHHSVYIWQRDVADESEA